MPLFDYNGQLPSGSAFQGTLEAKSREHAAATLAALDVRVTSLRAARGTAYVAPLSLDDFEFFNEQMAAMAKADVPLEEGLRQLAADVGSRKLKRLLLELANDLESGTPLDQAIAKQRTRFPTHYAGVVQAGLETGDLGGTLHALTTHLRLKSTARRILLELAAYPVMILTFAFVILSFLMRVVVPEIDATVRDLFGADLVWSAAASGYTVLPIDGLSNFIFRLAHHWGRVEAVLVLIAVILAVGLAATWLPRGRGARQWLLRSIPGVSQVYWSSILARFTHTSALAAFSGTPLPQILVSAGSASGSLSLASTTRRVAEQLEAGRSLQDAARGERDLPALWTFVVSVAGERGGLAGALDELARGYEVRAQQWISTLRIIFGPVLLVFVGAIMGAVILGMVLSLSSILNSLSGGY